MLQNSKLIFILAVLSTCFWTLTYGQDMLFILEFISVTIVTTSIIFLARCLPQQVKYGYAIESL